MRGRKLLVAVLLSTAGVAHAGDKPLYQAAPAWVLAAPAVDVAKLDDSAPVLQVFDQQQRLEDGLKRPGFSGGSFHLAMQPYRGSRGLHSNCLRPQRAGCAR
ncbi:hypothetical protein S2M10_11550 [Sphingomonas sp. S2M10]|nr:hypothetical protein [Sphingomonas sp. S2M10]